METPLLEERIDPTDDYVVFLDQTSVTIQTDGGAGQVTIEPKTSADAKKLSIAIRRAQRRVEAIGVNLARAGR